MPLKSLKPAVRRPQKNSRTKWPLTLAFLWPTSALSGAEPDPDPVPVRRAAPAAPKPQPASGQTGGVLAALLSNKAFHDTIKAEILEVLRTREGQELLADIVKKEINKQK